MKMLRQIKLYLISTGLLMFGCQKNDNELPSVDYEPVKIISNLQFAEGPAFYNGDLYFSDIDANRIYMWNESAGLTVFKENSGEANGLYFDNSGKLYVCESGNKRVVSIDASQKLTVAADQYNLKPFNEPNDLWISPKSDVYFTDPVYKGTLSQNGEYVYCIKASEGQVLKVVGDLVRPNGIIGNSNGTMLYIADHGAKIIYSYSIMNDGTLANKQVFASVQADGLTIDSQGNIYAASDEIKVFSSRGILIDSISIPGTLTNLCIGGTDNKTLFITTHNQVFTKQINY
ncbi:MAG: SMP-30/gluconolactonase/LRE family protein [Bacteroidales bacterium]